MNLVDMLNSWKTPIIKYLEDGTLPTNVVEARKLKIRATRFVLMQGYYTEEGFRSHTFVVSTNSKLNT
jgi:hypothetical protein